MNRIVLLYFFIDNLIKISSYIDRYIDNLFILFHIREYPQDFPADLGYCQKESPIKNRASRRPKQTENKFDSMMEAHLHKEDIEIDKKLKKYDPTPRTRNFDPAKVVCRVCGKKEEINPALLSDTVDRYKCNNCARSAG